MNKKGIKEIARIIQNCLVKEKGHDDHYFLSLHLGVVEDLADYFEREIPDCNKGHKHCSCLGYLHNNCCACGEYIFNKKQFLKDCGVD